MVRIGRMLEEGKLEHKYRGTEGYEIINTFINTCHISKWREQ